MARHAHDARILVVDDDLALGMVLVGLLSQAGWRAEHARSGDEALRRMEAAPYDLVVTDLRMPGMDGMALLKRIGADVPVIMLTAHGNIPTAVEAMRAGAVDFMAKPFDREEIVFTIEKALCARQRAADEPPEPPTGATELGSSPAMREVADLVRRASGTLSNVLVRGESGTGKEVVARAIHDGSARAKGPFVAVNCAALPVDLLESELFGHEKGAFTGAVSKKPGRVELARGGTLFLDEIGDVPLAAQAKLLRLIQEKEFQPLGGSRTERADVRFLAATHRDLEAMIREGQFREDLYYRLNVIPIWLPPLRERPGDVSELAVRFAESLGKTTGRVGVTFAPAALERLATHSFPGNVRELVCVVERLLVFGDGDVIGPGDVERELVRLTPPSGRTSSPSSSPVSSGSGDGLRSGETQSLESARAGAEREAVLEALGRAKGNRTQAARLLGVSRRTLYNRMSALGIADA
jgi:DNA-binding NtrC family response regulator